MRSMHLVLGKLEKGMTSMIKGILFDYDGTLSLRAKSAYYMYRSLVRQLFPELDENSIEAEAKVQRCILWDQFGSIDKRFVAKMIRDTWLPDLDIEAISAQWYNTFQNYQFPMPDVYETLEKLHTTYKIGILSNGHMKHQTDKINALNMPAYVDMVLTSGEIGIHKPDVRIFEEAAKRLGLACDEIAFVGDTFDTDILGAVKAGMMPVWFCYEHFSMTELNIKCVHTYKEIEELFLGEGL